MNSKKTPLHVLVVESDLSHLAATVRHLLKAGYQVDAAASATEALWATSHSHYDLILMDGPTNELKRHGIRQPVVGLDEYIRAEFH
jgi:CheY-like chemotaxis protein